MSEKDREKVGCGDGDTYIVSEYSVGYQAALAHSAAALADKDAEIDRLKQSIYRHEIGGSKLAVDNMNLQAEIERLKEALQVRSKQIGVACLKHDLTHALACGHCHANAQAEIARLQRVVEVLRDAPVHVTKDGVWLNFRCDHKAKIGTAMIKVEGYEAIVLANWGDRANAALAAAQQEG